MQSLEQTTQKEYSSTARFFKKAFFWSSLLGAAILANSCHGTFSAGSLHYEYGQRKQLESGYHYDYPYPEQKLPMQTDIYRTKSGEKIITHPGYHEHAIPPYLHETDKKHPWSR